MAGKRKIAEYCVESRLEVMARAPGSVYRHPQLDHIINLYVRNNIQRGQ